jgi:AcrR family transcriptional regulator
MARPKEFDAAEALASAVRLFWEKGYEGTSVSDLTDAMRITRPSLYGTFGNKEELFRRALQFYDAEYMGFVEKALAEPSVEVAVARLIYGYVDAQTHTETPTGCLALNGAVACSDEAEPIRQTLADRRVGIEIALCARLIRAREEGDLPVECDPADLARFVVTLALGTACQAKAGRTREELRRVVDIALTALPFLRRKATVSVVGRRGADADVAHADVAHEG